MCPAGVLNHEQESKDNEAHEKELRLICAKIHAMIGHIKRRLLYRFSHCVFVLFDIRNETESKRYK